jgi:hypothetical protein
MNRLLPALALAFALLPPAAAIADGKVFARVGPDPTIPDQQALIHYDGRIQTLAIETRFEGDGTEFAWVVPLPSIPEISAATTGLFPTLRAVFAPELIELNASGLGALLLLLAGVAIASVLAAAGQRRLAILVAIGSVVLAIGAAMPLLGKARAIPRGDTGVESPGITIHERQVVGSFETVTISSTEGERLTDWLEQNGFAVSAESRPVIAAYVEDGWVFVAIRLQRAVGEDVSTPHPLIFRFESARCVYPMRLTGVQNRPIALELYIFGSGSASAPGLQRMRSARVESQPGPGVLFIRHPGLVALAADAQAATKLVGTLEPAQMRRDLEVSFSPFRQVRSRVFRQETVWLLAMNTGLGIFTAGVLGNLIWRRFRRGRSSSVALPLVASLLIAAVAGFCIYAALPKASSIVRVYRSSHYGAASALQYAAAEAGEADPEWMPSLEWFRDAAERYHLKQADEYGATRPRHEDSPGNYIIQEANGDLEYVWFDPFGEPRSEMIWAEQTPKGTGESAAEEKRP